MPCFVTHLESAIDGTTLAAGQLQTMHKDRPLWVRYDLAAVAKSLTKTMLRDREPTLWRYRELLPVVDGQQIISLGEGMSPLLACPRDFLDKRRQPLRRQRPRPVRARR